MSQGKIRILLKRALTSTSSLTTSTGQITNKKAKYDMDKAADKVQSGVTANKTDRKIHRGQEDSSDWTEQFCSLSSSVLQQSQPSSSDSSSDSTEDDDENPLPAAFRLINGSESSNESDAERSEHEEEVIRRSKQIRNRERWELLKYKMLISSCCTPSKNYGKNGNGPSCKERRREGEEEHWDEEREREFVFSLL